MTLSEEPKTQMLALAGGMASLFLYMLSITSGGFSLLLGYVPLIPLFAVGLAYGLRPMIIAALAATVMVGLFSNLPGMLVYLLLYAVPTVFFIQITLAMTPDEGKWYPMGGVLTGLALYTACLAAISLMVMADPDMGLAEFFPEMKGEEISPLMQQAKEMLTHYPFLIISIAAWIQIGMFYGAAILVNFMLKGWDRQLRSNLRLTPFMPSLFVLGVMLIAGLMSFSESKNVQLAGQTAFVVLLLPYGLMGLAQMHVKARRWSHANLWLTAIYTLSLLALWPIFWFIGAGIVEQAKFLSNRHGGGTDT